MKLARLRGNPRRTHVTPNEVKTGCGAFIPEDAKLSRDTAEWYLHINCYNCAYRLWPANTGYIRPRNSQDFPPRRECPHAPGAEHDPKSCQMCTPFNPDLARPCPKGCPEPHDPRLGLPSCTIYPPQREVPDGERCLEGCETESTVMGRANPGVSFDFSDGAMMRCYHCGELVPPYYD
jgi:hypothetical protein